MRVLVTGAYGLIGSAILARLHRDGQGLVGAGRTIDEARRRFPYAHWIAADFASLPTPQAWLPLLADVDTVVNCVGVLQDSARDDVQAVQVAATCALFDACAATGIRRVVHVSAMGVAPGGATAFSQTKAQADAHLSKLDLDWIILRPALVLAPAAYGGSAMLRALAGFPLVTPLTGAENRVQVIGIDDVAETVATVLRANGEHGEARTRAIWELAHPQVHTVGEVVSRLRDWHGFAPQPKLRLPDAAQGLIAMAADAVGLLGWRSPARSTALKQLSMGVVGDPTAWTSATGIRPDSLDDILARHPATVQDRWFARLYWLKPLAIITLALFWIVTGLIALRPGHSVAVAQLMQAGLSPAVAEGALVLSSILDIVIGLGVCVQRWTRLALLIMLAVSAAYLLVGTLSAPQLWFDPIGPYLKIIPIMLATVFTLAIVDER